MRGKIPVIQQAATGSLNSHHRLIEQWLGLWDELAARITKFEERIEEQMRPFAGAVKTWASLPGVDRITARTIVAEMGPDLARFPPPRTPLPGPVCARARRRARQTAQRPDA